MLNVDFGAGMSVGFNSEARNLILSKNDAIPTSLW
jgi:hypothetical protein